MVVSKSLASETPSTVQFDLVFPKNNTIYEPTYPSPLVVAIHNASALKQHTVYWSWNITESPYWPTEETPKIIASGMSRPHAILKNVMEQTQLIIEPISALFNNTSDLLALRYSFDVTHACDVPSFSSTVVVFEGEIYFKMSRKLSDSEPGDNPNAWKQIELQRVYRRHWGAEPRAARGRVSCYQSWSTGSAELLR
jgi:hypothetical protein